nr:PREDICTED: cell growth-regulating nucleolar protein [Bemisia tabaci]
MVAFTCNACGASVKKAAVEKHYFGECRRSRVVDVTCIDCLQDFDAETYPAHIRCLTENEKYGEKGTVERANNKGEVKQQDWLGMIARIYETHPLNSKHKQILQHIINLDNIPRKKKPFLNFMKNSARMFAKDESVIESLYDILDKEFKAMQAANSNAKRPNIQNGSKAENVAINCDETPVENSEVVSEKKKKRRHKLKSESREESTASAEAENSLVEPESENNPPPSEEAADSDKKLSKKERKEKKKRDKYLTELNEIEKYEKTEEPDNSATADEEVSGKKKKEKKNRHKSESEMETVSAKTTVDKNGTDDSAPIERKLSKKEKKRKISENAAAEAEAKKKHKHLKGSADVPEIEQNQGKDPEGSEEETQEFIKPNKFKIDKVVQTILDSHGGEIALKRLAKRVCTEYQIRCGVQDADYIMAKFQKKIYNIPGVKIIKDKAVLQN